jgi:hypothetical protein
MSEELGAVGEVTYEGGRMPKIDIVLWFRPRTKQKRRCT